MALFVSWPISLMVAPLYFFSRSVPAAIRPIPIGVVTGSGAKTRANPIFCIFFPGDGALCVHLNDAAVDLPSNFAMSVYSEALRLAELDALRTFSSFFFRGSTTAVRYLEKCS